MMNEWIISSSVLIAAVLLGRYLLRGKISLRLQYALWGIVLLRLLLPFQIFTSPFGTGAVSEQVDLTAPVRQVYHSANEDRYEQAYDTAYREVKHSIAIAHPDPIVIEQAARELAQSRMELDLARSMLRVWLVGMAVMAAVIVGCNVHLAVRLRRHRWEMEVSGCLLPVYVTEVVPTPCIFGLFRPVIYLTPQTAEEGQVRDHVLEHELTHYRHLDHIWSVLRSLCLVLHWYNPLVWAAAKVSRADSELACDEGALARLGEEARGDYGRTLIGLTCSAPISDLLLTATTMTGSPGSIRERIRLLMKRPRNTVLTVITVILMVTLIVGCTFAGAPETTAPAETTNPGVDNDMSCTDQDLPIPENFTQTELSYARPMQKAMEDYADKNPRKLTTEEIKQANEAFASTVYDEERDEFFVTAVAAFFTSDYDDVTELDLAEFLRYFPVTAEATEEEFQLLRQKYGAEFDFSEHETLRDMPVPVHRYTVSDIDGVFRRYANIPFQEVKDKDSVYYLEETDSYYNFTSDFGPGMFDCIDGFVYDGGAILYSANKALFLTESGGHYSIKAHLHMIREENDRVVTENDSFTEDGLLVYPGTQWGMSEEELLNALNIQKYGTFSGMRGIHLPTTTFCGYPASIAFYFGQYDNHQEWGLTEVTVRFADAEAANAVCDILTGQLGESDFQTSGVTSCAWRSEARLEDLLRPEAYAVYREQYTESLLNSGAASTIAWFGKGDPEMENTIVFSSSLHLARQVEARMEVTDPVAGEGLLAYPGTRWFMTENEVLAALGMTARDILQGAYTTQENGMTASSVTVNHKDAFGVSMVLDFTFRAYWPGAEPVLTEVYGHFIDREGFEAVRSIYARELGDTDTKITPGVVEQWDSQILLRELVGMEGYEILDRCAADALNVPATHVQWVDNGTLEIIWSTELPDPGTPDWTNQPLAENP